MESFKDKLHQLAKQLNLTGPDDKPDPYILTKDDEDRIIEHEIISAKKHLVWKMTQLAMLPEQIEFKINQINWDEQIDKEDILRRANVIKNHEIWQKQQREKERQEEIRKAKELKDTWTANKVYQLMAHTSQYAFGKKLIVNDENKGLITALCFFISRDDRFETRLGLSLKKGLLIRGISGIGKTYLVKCIENNELNPILILSMLDIANSIKENGEYFIKKEDKRIIYLDDVGTEEATVNHYGTKINFFKNFIESTYLRTQQFNNLIISTNNSFSEMESSYGFRVRSRIKDMFNIIDVKGNDMRG